MLVVASMAIFHDPVSLLQMFGYSIALSGLVYYKLGAEKLKEYISQGGRSWSEYGSTNPVMKKVIIAGVVILFVFILLGGLAPFVPDEYSQRMVAGVTNAKQGFSGSKIGSSSGSN